MPAATATAAAPQAAQILEKARDSAKSVASVQSPLQPKAAAAVRSIDASRDADIQPGAAPDSSPAGSLSAKARRKLLKRAQSVTSVQSPLQPKAAAAASSMDASRDAAILPAGDGLSGKARKRQLKRAQSVASVQSLLQAGQAGSGAGQPAATLSKAQKKALRKQLRAEKSASAAAAPSSASAAQPAPQALQAVLASSADNAAMPPVTTAAQPVLKSALKQQGSRLAAAPGPQTRSLKRVRFAIKRNQTFGGQQQQPSRPAPGVRVLAPGKVCLVLPCSSGASLAAAQRVYMCTDDPAAELLSV